MSIASEIQRIQNNIADTYTVISNKGGTLPATQNSANLASAITSITGGGGSSILYPHCTPNYNINTTSNKLVYNNGIISNFRVATGNNRWLYGDKYFPNYTALPFTTFELVITLKVGSFNSSDNIVYASSESKQIFDMGITPSGNLFSNVGSGSGWYSLSLQSSNTIQLNTFYNIKLAYDGTNYTISVATDFTNYEEWISVASTDYLGKNLAASANVKFQLGASRGHDSWYSNTTLEVDLSKSYMKINDSIYWQGLEVINSNDLSIIQGFDITTT